MKKLFFLVMVFVFSLNMSIFSQEKIDHTPVPYDTEELPDVIKDFRRFEIITLGSIPFVAIDASLGYSSYKKISGKSDVFPNPFSSSSENGYTVKEQKALLYTTLGISVGIGLTDLIIRLVKRKKTTRINEYKTQDHIYIEPIALDDDEDIPPYKPLEKEVLEEE
ncbi:MAG: hypothetical protein MJ176_06220 [Treponema sp.]|nr:hypothetical protein [Treponema sp.]